MKQFTGIFTEDELRSFEGSIDEMLEHDERWLENTLDVSPKWASGDKKRNRLRTKHFFPQYTYGGGHTPQRGDCGPTPLWPCQRCPKCKGAQAIVTDKCNDIPDWIYHPEQSCLAKTLIELGIIKDAWANSAILNTYHKSGGKLMQHFDSCHLFVRPIVGLSLFGTKSLSFGLKTTAMKAAAHHYTVEQQRGVITIVYGYAADKINHGVQCVGRKASTLLLRRVFPELLSDEWKEKNTMRCKIAGPARADIQERVDDVAGREPVPCRAAAAVAESKPDSPCKRAARPEDGPAEKKRRKADGDNAPPKHRTSTGASSSSSTLCPGGEPKNDSLGELYRQHVLGMPCIEVESARPASSDSPPPRLCDAGEPPTQQPIARTGKAADLASPSSAPWPLAAPRLPRLQERTQTDTDGVGGSASKLAISDKCSNSGQDNTAATGSPEAQGEIPEPADSTATPAAFEAARVLKAEDTVKLLTGSRAGALGIVTEVAAGDCEVDAEQWFARSQLEFQY